MKKILLSLIMLCALVLAQTAFAADEVARVTVNGIDYGLLDDYTALIHLDGGANATGDIVLPSFITHEGKDYALTTICDQAFRNNANITSVIIPNSVSAIGVSAFGGCTILTSVTIGAFVQSIGAGAFLNCPVQKIIFYPTTLPALGAKAIPNTKIYCVYSYGAHLETFFGTSNLQLEPLFHDFNSDSGISLYAPAYINNIIDAINIATKRVTLTNEEVKTIEGSKDNISAAFEKFIEEFNENRNETNCIRTSSENELTAHKLIAIAGIRQALPTDGLTEGEQTAVDGKTAKINNATSLAAIYTTQKETFDYLAFHPNRRSALADIEAVMQGNAGSAALHNFVKSQVDAINGATNAGTINENRNAAVDMLNNVIDLYKNAKAEGQTDAFGTLGTEQDGPALIVTDKDGNEIILYSPKSVEYIKVKEEE